MPFLIFCCEIADYLSLVLKYDLHCEFLMHWKISATECYKKVVIDSDIHVNFANVPA